MKRTNHYLQVVILYIAVSCLLISTDVKAQWVLIDTVSFTELIPVGEKCYVSLQSEATDLELTLPPGNLTVDAEAAVEIAPGWLKMDLKDNLRRLDEDDQNLYAGIIINAVDPYIDEICFEVAHIAPQTLSSNMALQILTENVESLYEIAGFFDYVEIVNYDGDDFYSTTIYKVLEQGDTIEIELPRDIYYWYIVHPKLHKEIPNYINPSTGSPADPPTGVFWRDYLMNHNDAGYPLLRNYLDTCDVFWKGEQNTVNNGAVGALTQWIKDVMTFQSNPHNDQPVRIYHQHLGTCSVHSYLTSAAARAALIPTAVDAMYSNNHKINEFWERRWIAWEPVNTYIDNPGGYENWGWDVASNFNWRGDSFIWDATERYTEVCTLNVNVVDNYGMPVDGARIKIFSSPCVSWGCTAGWTDYNGQKQIYLGDNRTYTAQVTSDIGNYPATGTETVITDSGSGIFYNWDVTLSGTLPVIDVSPATMPPNPTDDFRIVLEYDLPREITYGVNFDNNNVFSQPTENGHIDFFICDEDNFNNYTANQNFQAFEIHQGSSGNTIDFVLPTEDSWYAVFSNEDKLVLTEELNVTAYLYRDSLTAIHEAKNQLPEVILYQNYPNPCNNTTTIDFLISDNAFVSLKVYDNFGKEVVTLINEIRPAGKYKVNWETADLPNGVYYYRLQTGDITKIRKAILMK
ncbi:MAG: T9SS type A sorting domain-containing protein [Bacteroidales bacterium]|nr:T9SS type A sorting domain-containing protein [Bacteroidales bacterium]